jgi:hypothetical protein
MTYPYRELIIWEWEEFEDVMINYFLWLEGDDERDHGWVAYQ